MGMKKKKALAWMISLALAIGVVLPGTLAVSADSQTGDPGETIIDSTTTQNDPVVDEGQTSEGGNTETASTEEPGTTEVPENVEQPAVCTCGATNGVHAEGCALYVAPEEPEQPACTCGTTDGVHAEGCALYESTAELEKPEIVHLETCTEDCTGEGCSCECHALSLFDRLMACDTPEELLALIEATPEEELLALTEDEVAQVEEKVNALEPESAPAIVVEESEPPVKSEVVAPAAVNYDNVAPFGKPVVGGSN